MRAYLQLMRYGNCSMAAFAVAIGVLIAYNILKNGSIIFSYYDTGLVCLVGFLVTGGGNAINDYFDVDIDAINKPLRPIPSGQIKLLNALYFSLILFALGTLLAFVINPICGIIALFNSLLLIYYARTLKRTMLVGNIAVAYLTGSTFLFGGALFGLEGLEVLLVLFLLATFATVAREIVKDIEDIEGDKKDGASTLPIKLGVKSSAYIAASIGFIAVLLSPLPYLQSIIPSTTYLYIVALADVFFVIAAFEILVMNDAAKSSKLFKIAMAFALVSFLAGG
ncbi:MAG: geranylgeranylglycerol-phosphate geranylgeranyltransferase [Methanosarcinaceae archaeon]|nr:geranylgeranylglycerol-phosphate geranylgeranyltransferase [Methanosarcinaceae archaeon]